MSVKNFISKDATQQSLFLKKYPEFDGRGIKIAIIDTDVVDISLPGLQHTSTGLRKIVNIFPRTGITVNTSTVIESNNKNIFGLSGRKLKVSSKWKNPLCKWHIGSMSIKDFYYKTMAGNASVAKSINKNDLAVLEDKIIDCIVWFDGNKWRACIDNSFEPCFSNLEHLKVLTNYNDEHEVAYFVNEIIYCVNISDDGNLLEISCPLHFHGTSVTQVAAAYFPDNPEQNGLAPGAQIVSMNRDNIEEAVQKCIDIKVDIINFSITVSQSKIEIIEKMVKDHGIIITKSAGNQGPFYSTLFEGIWSSENTFILGAVFTEDEQKLFNYKVNVNSVHYFSSKGPLPSGARGIDLVAPGTVLLDLPKWYSNKNQRQFGTSFAAPTVAGLIACLLSALKANEIPYSPAMIKVALANTASLPEGADRLALGHGIIQIYDAFEFIKKSINNLPMKSVAPIFLNEPKQKGILLIYNDKNNNISVKSYYVNIYPEIVENWILKCTSRDKNFITEFNIVKNNLINVKIDTSLLEEGSLNYAEIHGIDSLNPSIGPLFYLPITVIRTADSKNFSKEITVNPGSSTHLFFESYSKFQQYCTIKITPSEVNKKERTIILQFLQNGKTHQAMDSIRGYIVCNFNAKKNVGTWMFIVGKDNEEYFELCIRHANLNPLNLKLDLKLQEKND